MANGDKNRSSWNTLDFCFIANYLWITLLIWVHHISLSILSILHVVGVSALIMCMLIFPENWISIFHQHRRNFTTGWQWGDYDSLHLMEGDSIPAKTIGWIRFSFQLKNIILLRFWEREYISQFFHVCWIDFVSSAKSVSYLFLKLMRKRQWR